MLHLGCYMYIVVIIQKSGPIYYIQEFKQAEIPILDSKSNGGFLDSCLAHCQSLSDAAWIETQVNNQSARETFSYWYFGRSGERKVIDCAYPCNKSCK